MSNRRVESDRQTRDKGKVRVCVSNECWDANVVWLVERLDENILNRQQFKINE